MLPDEDVAEAAENAVHLLTTFIDCAVRSTDALERIADALEQANIPVDEDDATSGPELPSE